MMLGHPLDSADYCLVLAGACRSDRVDVIAVASRDRPRAEVYAREHGLERAYGSYDAMLEEPTVEAVYISLPSSTLVEWTLRALAAGKPMLCEKPFSRRAHEVEGSSTSLGQEELVLSEGLMWRSTPPGNRGAGSTRRRRRRRTTTGDLCSFQLAAVHGVGDARFGPELQGGC